MFTKFYIYIFFHNVYSIKPSPTRMYPLYLFTLFDRLYILNVWLSNIKYDVTVSKYELYLGEDKKNVTEGEVCGDLMLQDKLNTG